MKTTRLNQSQMGVYLDSLDCPESTKYNITIEYAFEKSKYDAQSVKAAVEKAVAVHPAFCARFVSDDEGPLIEFVDNLKPNVSLNGGPDATYQAIVETFAKPYDLATAPLYKILVYEAPKKIYVLVDIHHLIFDGTSGGVFYKSICEALEGREPEKEQMSLADAAIAESKQDTTKAEEYFNNYIGGVDTDSNLSPDADIPQDADKNLHCTCSIKLNPADTSAKLKAAGATESALFMASVGYALAKYTYQKESLFCTVEHGRHTPKLANTTGMFVKTLPVYLKIDEEQKIADYIKYVRETYVATRDNNLMSFGTLSAEYGIRADIKFVYQSGITSSYLIYENPDAMSNMDIQIFRNDADYTLSINFRKSMYTQQLIEQFAASLCFIIEQFTADATKALKDIKLVSAETEAILNKFNETEKAYDDTETPMDYLERQIKAIPDHIAVEFKDKQYTYAQFGDITDRLAAYLNSKGIKNGDYVSIIVNRNHLMPITAWGVVKSGAAYQPLDPTYPTERLNFMVNDSGAKLLIAERNLRPLLAEYKGEVLYTDELDSLPAGKPTAKVTPDDTLIIIYTSGTTGIPKGGLLSHKNIVNLFVYHKDNFGLSTESKVASYASFGFDAGMMDLFCTLMAGGRICVIPDEIRLSLDEMNKFYCENNITAGFMTTQVGSMFAQSTTCTTLRHLMMGGEKLVPFTPPKGVHCFNAYGPSECATYITHYDIKDNSIIQPIGKAGRNTKLYIIDKYNRRLPVGACGELCIAGPQVGKGYFKRPDKTAEAFTANPFCSSEKHNRIYHTGDVVRFLPSGDCDFIGRRDAQVKIRGFRVELTEIEQIIRRFPDIDNATVQAFDASAGGKYIAAYIVSGKTIDINELNAFIGAEKPPYMIPAVTVQVDNIPLNANGKVDKRKLPVATPKFEDAIEPRNDAEKALYSIVTEILNAEGLGVNTNLYTAGLSSIASIKLIALILKKLGKSIKIADLKAMPTIEQLAKFMEGQSGEEKFEMLPDYPLTKTQEGIFSECMANPGGTTYNIPLLLKISKKIDIERLKKAIISAIEAHPYIKTRLITNAEGDIRLERRDNDNSFTADSIRTLKKLDKQSLVKPYTLMGGQLFNICIICDRDNYLFIDTHHIISDGTSLTILVQDIAKAYNGEKLAKEEFTGFEKSLLEEQERKSEHFEKAKEYYEKLLGGFDESPLPISDLYEKGPAETANLNITSSTVAAADVKKFCSETAGASLNGFFTAAFGYTLARFSASEYATFTTVYNGRSDSRFLQSISMYVKTLPIVCNIAQDKETLVKNYVSAISEQLQESMANDIYSFSEISRALDIKPDVMFVYQGEQFGFTEFCGEPSELISIESTEAKEPISLQLFIKNGKIEYACEYRTDMFSPALMESLILSFDAVIGNFIKERFVADVSLMHQKSLSDIKRYNTTDFKYDKSENMIDFLKRQVKKHPDEMAVYYEGTSYTYKEFDRLTDNIAAYLTSQGVKRGDFVSILIGRSEYMVICAWGVIKCGAAYQPLDPSYPAERLNFMVNDCKARYLIAERNLRDVLSEYHGETLFTDAILTLPDAKFTSQATPTDPIIITYTSGTTGLPKGCVLEQRNIVCFCHAHCRSVGQGEGSHVALHGSFGFDPATMDITTTIMSGGTVFIIPEDLRLDLNLINKFFIDHSITHCSFTTQMGSMFAAMTTCKTLVSIGAGGEKLVPFKPQKYFKYFNEYGPTECTVYVTKYHVRSDSTLQPIGEPLENTKIYIADKNGLQLPLGACGELYICGGQVGREYLGRPEKTAEAFIKNTFENVEGYERIYRTGDIARRLCDGNVDFVGRRDGQVKVRGFRVELTEVEQIIRNFPDIENATVQAFDSPNGGKEIAAYIVSEKQIDIDALNAFIGADKPPYMVPSVTMQIDSIPLNVNQKVDKRKLPKPEFKARKSGRAPETQLEKDICKAYEETLKMEGVAATDNFFEIGGSSILASKLVLKFMEKGINVVYKNIFDNPTPEKLAAFLNGQGAPAAKETANTQPSAVTSSPLPPLGNLKKSPLGTVLVAGATGFLGMHVLREVIAGKKEHGIKDVVCLVRGGQTESAKDRLKVMAMYYFGGLLTPENIDEITVIDGDITEDDTLTGKFKDLKVDTIINCAACVKHFAAGDLLDKVNVQGVRNLIALAKAQKAKLVQVSTISVAGESVNNSVASDVILDESMHYFGQTLENKYIKTKFEAEKLMLEAMDGGMSGKIIRVGNLMSRAGDGEFQINSSTNGFMSRIKAYYKLGVVSIDDLDSEVEFSPIDITAKAVVTLAETPDEFRIFHANNCHNVHFANIVDAMNKKGLKIDVVEPEEFGKRLKEKIADEDHNIEVSALISYMNNDGEQRRMIPASNNYTIKALYRLGFSWPIIDMDYIECAIEKLITLRFFKKI